jgi:hypothetical protein
VRAGQLRMQSPSHQTLLAPRPGADLITLEADKRCRARAAHHPGMKMSPKWNDAILGDTLTCGRVDSGWVASDPAQEIGLRVPGCLRGASPTSAWKRPHNSACSRRRRRYRSPRRLGIAATPNVTLI